MKVPEGVCVMEISLPPTQGTTLRTHFPRFTSIGILASSEPFFPEVRSKSGMRLAFSVIAISAALDCENNSQILGTHGPRRYYDCGFENRKIVNRQESPTVRRVNS